ncbi:hypothetical protein FJV41_36380 [Myxococcus llanfairpwllgwyngyllgogerychwyrndrobwllllantysiliogogogochensis]|uniref:Uncharacterized protein n=1 Tax=Myxococcus llanfairpwllgwyngyllgogerychwyrndrobwllllantysiliogogogochensis TaxID=2590453 RepID=A0A540WPT0_9BACT|nr:hypothetical protein [Myxococcus llanfairpwllgwyngyllgogerychwyrndrobwllllantysiliogogogochensis]TQF11031.1 hypothetical protein FJV41_36380 [Myxococcus llanfairpwllgwyngyllgogerychwyrndrobwllllantysiliogogogochensis]
MAIHEVTAEDVLQRCARCGSGNRLSLNLLEVGVANREDVDDGLVQLPPCPACRSTEFLIRAAEGEPEHPAPGSFGHLHRLLVGHIHAELVQRGRLHMGLKSKGGRAGKMVLPPLPQETRERWFPQGLRIAVPADEQPRAPEESS